MVPWHHPFQCHRGTHSRDHLGSRIQPLECEVLVDPEEERMREAQGSVGISVTFIDK